MSQHNLVCAMNTQGQPGPAAHELMEKNEASVDSAFPNDVARTRACCGVAMIANARKKFWFVTAIAIGIAAVTAARIRLWGADGGSMYGGFVRLGKEHFGAFFWWLFPAVAAVCSAAAYCFLIAPLRNRVFRVTGLTGAEQDSLSGRYQRDAFFAREANAYRGFTATMMAALLEYKEKEHRSGCDFRNAAK